MVERIGEPNYSKDNVLQDCGYWHWRDVKHSWGHKLDAVVAQGA